MEVLDTLHKVHRVCMVDSFNFSALYTLLKSMAKLIRDAFSCRSAEYIIVDEKITNVRPSLRLLSGMISKWIASMLFLAKFSKKYN